MPVALPPDMYREHLIHSGGGLRGFLPGPTTLREFTRRFPDEEACRDFLFREIYPQGFTCPRCGSTAFRWLTSKRLRCAHPTCRHHASLTANTILHRCRKPLLTWFLAAFYVCQFGMNATQLAEKLKLTYKVAWTWCHKLRAVMSTQTTLDDPVPPFDLDAFLQARYRFPTAIEVGRHAREHGNLLLTAARPGGLGTCCERLSAEDWQDWDAEECHDDDTDDSNDTAASGSLSNFDDGRRRADDDLQPDVQRPPIPWELRSLNRDYSGSISDKHLPAYLKELEFRHNHRFVPAFEVATKLIAWFPRTPIHTYRGIVGAREQRPLIQFGTRDGPGCPRPPALERMAPSHRMKTTSPASGASAATCTSAPWSRRTPRPTSR